MTMDVEAVAIDEFVEDLEDVEYSVAVEDAGGRGGAILDLSEYGLSMRATPMRV